MNKYMKRVNSEFGLPVSFIKERDVFIAYTPALDLSTMGKTLKEAKKNFIEAVNIFFEEIIRMGTVDDVLTELGWKKEDGKYIPPVVVSNQTETFSFQLPA